MTVLKERFAEGVELPVVVFMAVVHLLAIGLALLFPSWQGLMTLAVLYVITGGGVTIGYHRLLTHGSFQCPQTLHYLWALLGLLSGEGPPLYWVAHHRKHHKHSDKEGDPHSPMDGFWWAHMLWLFPRHNRTRLGRLYARWAPDLLKHPFYLRLEQSYLYWQLVFAGLLFCVGLVWGGWYVAASLLAYGFLLRMVLVLHITWAVNSAAHLWGYRNYPVDDGSRNNMVVGLLAGGEGWHNNHHFVQRAANHGQRWWEVDASFAVILFLALLSYPLKWVGLGRYRLAYDIRVYSWRTQQFSKWFV